MRVGFGPCVIDTDTREVLRDGRPAHLTPRAFRLLELLIEQRPRALSKSELQDALWPGTFVTEASLSSLVADVRSAIGEEAHGAAFIRTVQRHGYAFSGEARVLADRSTAGPSLSYRLIWNSREMALDEGETILGRSREATLFIDDESVSRRHARIVINSGAVVVEDLGSKNGTTVNGERLTAPARVDDGATIQIGSVTMRFRVFEDADSTKPTRNGGPR